MSTPVRIVVTVADPSTKADPVTAAAKNRLYAAAIARHGAEPILLDASIGADERAAALAEMSGLVLSGGADVDPARYGRPNLGSTSVEPARDALEVSAWEAASQRRLPVLGICRGFQLINVLLGGTLNQDVAGHEGPSWGSGPAHRHALRVVPGTRLARILFPTNVGGGVVTVNSYHHQAVGPADVAPGLIASAFSASPIGELVEALETIDNDRLVLGVQCHPERQESTPASFERLFGVFVDACRGPAVSRPAVPAAREFPTR